MAEKLEPATEKQKIQAITDALESVGYAILGYRIDLNKEDNTPNGIIDLRVIPGRMIV